MRPHRIVAAAIAAALTLSGTALAGNWAQVTVTDRPAEPPVGTTATIELRVLQHGETAVSWPTLTVVAKNADTGEVVRIGARADGPAGRYLADLILPAPGDWALSFESAELAMEGSGVIRVAAAAVVAAPAGPTEAPTQVVPVAVAALLAAALGLGLLAAARARRRGAPEPFVRAGG